MRTVLAALAVVGCSKSTDPVRVAASCDLSGAFDELAAAFQAKTGTLVERGTPTSLLAGAKADIDRAMASGTCEREARLATGRLVVLARKLAPPRSLAELGDPRYRRIAIANPDKDPYGNAAREALRAAHLWNDLHDRLLITDTIEQAASYVRAGTADAGLVAMSLAAADGPAHVAPVDPALYTPIELAVAVCGPGGAELADFVFSPDGTAILARYGLR